MDNTDLTAISAKQLDTPAYIAKSHVNDDLLSFFNGECVIRIANSMAQRDRAYAFIYKIYRRLGYARPNIRRKWLTVFDALPETTTLIAENKDGEVVGVLTLVFDSAMGLPADAMFKPQLDSLRSSGARIFESMSFATAENSRGSVKTIAGLFFCGYLLALRAKAATHWVTNVIESHEGFYCRNLLFERVGDARECQRIQGRSVVLLVLPLHLPDTLRNVCRIFPLSLMKFTESEERDISRQLQKMIAPMTESEFKFFLRDNTDIYESASTFQKDHLEKIYAPLGKSSDYRMKLES